MTSCRVAASSRASISAFGCPCSGPGCSSAGLVVCAWAKRNDVSPLRLAPARSRACAPGAKAAAKKAAASHSGALRSCKDEYLTDCWANGALSEPPWIPRVVFIVGALTVCGAGDGLSITTQAHAPTNVPPRHANASITRSILELGWKPVQIVDINATPV